MSEDLDLSPLYVDLAMALFECFVIRKDAYAVQMPDGAYKTIKQPLTKARIRQMLRAGESLLSYQFEGNMTRWLCLDFDVPKKALQEPTTPEIRLQQIATLFSAVQEASGRLLRRGVEHLVEFSGNRGFHVWILFEEKLSRGNGHALLTSILRDLALPLISSDINIDLFPSAATSTAEFGHGVKLPLSLHKKSGCYSYFLDPSKAFSVTESVWVRSPSAFFLREQLAVIRKCPRQNLGHVAQAVGFALEEAKRPVAGPKYIRSDPKIAGRKIRLHVVQEQLSQCNIIRMLLERSASGERLSEKERLPIVGLLNRLHSADEPDLGQRLALEFFSTVPGFKPEVTRSKLSELRLFPPTCSFLKVMFPHTLCSCGEENEMASPLQFLEDLVIDERDIFSISEDEASSIASAQINYTRLNDEVALATTIAQLETLDPASACLICNVRNTKSWPPLEVSTFERLEEDGRVRPLVALGARDKLWTTAAIRQLHRLYSFDFSPFSHGYRIQPDMASYHLFRPWLTQWKAFTGRLSRYIFSPHCDSYYLVKIDIKSFYSSINLGRLLVKLSDGPTSSLEALIKSLSPGQREKYREICSQLVDLCKTIQQSDQGLPQGPAFARYLAEVFLMDFDRKIESLLDEGVICYARYVDDIFLVIDPDSDHKTLEAAAIEALHCLGLEINPSKHYSGLVSDYRASFARYRQDTKYLVDQVSRRFRASSNEEIKNAAERLRMLVEGEFGEGPHNEHLNFLYTHLDEDPTTKSLRRKYEKHVLGLVQGRGSFFSNFFSAYLMSKGRLTEDSEALNLLTGLRRQVFINSVLVRIVNGEDTPGDLAGIKSIFTVYLVDMDPLERELIAVCALIRPEVCPESLFQRLSGEDLVRILSLPLSKDVPKHLVSDLHKALLRLPLAEFTARTHDVVFNNRFLSDDSADIGKLFVDRVLNSLHEKKAEFYRLPFLLEPAFASENLASKHYQICCLVSCIRPNHSQSAQEALWRSMINSYNEIDEVDLGYPLWISKISDDLISFSNVNMVLVASVGNGFATGELDEHGIFATYLEYLALCTLLPPSERSGLEKTRPEDSRFEGLRTRLRNEQAPFLKWILEDPPADFYPNRIECLENIVRNDMMLLRRGSEILVRIRSELSERPEFSHLDGVEKFDEELMNSRYRTIKYNFPADGHESYSDRLTRSQGLISFVQAVLEIRDETERFSSIVGVANRFVNVLASDARFFRSNRLPLVPYTIHGKQLVSSKQGALISRPNSSLGLVQGLSDLIRSCERGVLDYSHECNLNGSQLVDALTIFSTEQEQWIFLRRFSEYCLAIENLGVHDVEYCKATALLQTLKERTPPEGLQGIYVVPITHLFLRMYLSTRGRHEEHRLLAFGQPLTPSRQNLGLLYNSVVDSLAEFRKGFEYDTSAFNIDALLKRELSEILISAAEKLGQGRSGRTVGPAPSVVSADMFTECGVEIEPETGEVRVDEELVSSRNSDVSDGLDVYACFVLSGDLSFRRIGEHMPGSASGGKLLAYQFVGYSTRLLVIAGGPLSASFDRVQTRSANLRNLSQGPRYQAMKSFYVNTRSVENSLRGLPRFSQAVRIVAEHHGCSDDEARLRLVRWILCFPQSEHLTLVRVISAHEVVTKDDRVSFLKNLGVMIKEPRRIFCSIKRLMDINGTHRLIMAEISGAAMMRGLKLESFVELMCKRGESGESDNRLVLVADVCISGSQMKKALRYYFLGEVPEGRTPEDELWYAISDGHREKFDAGIKSIREVCFVFALYTEQARNVLLEVCVSVLGLPRNSIVFKGRMIEDRKAFIFRNPDIIQETQSKFFELVSQVEFVESVFQLQGKGVRKEYRRSVAKMDTYPLDSVVRYGSMPKRGAMIFWLRPHDMRTEPLFNRIEEHPGE